MAHKILKFRITGKVNKMILYRGKGGKACGKKITKVKEKSPVKAVKVLVLVLSVIAHSRGSCITCIRGKRRNAKGSRQLKS